MSPSCHCQGDYPGTLSGEIKAHDYQWLYSTNWGRDEIDDILQTTFSNAFFYENVLITNRFHWSLFPRVQSTLSQHWFRWWLVADQATSHYLKHWWFYYQHIYASLGLNQLKTGHQDCSPSNGCQRDMPFCLSKDLMLSCILDFRWTSALPRRLALAVRHGHSAGLLSTSHLRSS